MKYVSEIINNRNEYVYYSDIRDIRNIKVTDDITGEVIEYHTEEDYGLDIHTIMTLDKTVYGFINQEGVWLTRPCDLALYSTIEFVERYKEKRVCFITIEEPIDEAHTLLPNWKRYPEIFQMFTIAHIIYIYDTDFTNLCIINNDIIEIYFKKSGFVYRYKIIDMKKFRILITKYRVLNRK